jgi:hypothetical protein
MKSASMQLGITPLMLVNEFGQAELRVLNERG